MATMADSLQRFIFEHAPIRGEMVQLAASWQAVTERHDYPAPLRQILGELMAAGSLLAATLKFDGTLILQMHGSGPVKLIVVECPSDHAMRPPAKWDGEIPQGNRRTLPASGLAMCRAIGALAIQPAAALVDGNYRFKLPCPIQTVVKGDSLSLSIAAASILAKTARDRLTVELDEQYPGYGFAGHKGYNAPVHQAALRTLGPCPAHRPSWAPMRALLEA